MTKIHFKILSLIAPIIILSAMITMQYNAINTGIKWRIPISGFDPRDILRGHYLTFQYDWNWKEQSGACKGRPCVLCLEESAPNNNYNPTVFKTQLHHAKEQCQSFAAGHQSTTFGKDFYLGYKGDNRLTRYYISEDKAPLLDSLLRNQEKENLSFDIELSITKNGHAQIKDLYINDKKLDDWLKENEHNYLEKKHR